MKKVLIISAISCASVLCIALIVATFLFFSAAREVAQQEFTPLNITPEKLPFAVSPSPQSPGIIYDLAFIKVLAVGYSDDADPEEDGLSIDVVFYDSASQPINFRSVPITIHIQIYAYQDPLDALENRNAELIYEGSVSLDHSMAIGEMFGRYIRIPYSEIGAAPNHHTPFGTLKVTVDTPAQGSFSASQDGVQIYVPKP
ncbi:hypothetical protein FBQ81_11570 [Chloroflexi bacterium CFX6]|nr:hypothetical protein [Chloroflexi bacterium CFX6]